MLLLPPLSLCLLVTARIGLPSSMAQTRAVFQRTMTGRLQDISAVGESEIKINPLNYLLGYDTLHFLVREKVSELKFNPR